MRDRRWLGLGLVATLVGFASCGTRPVAVEELPTAESTLAEVGKRLSQSLSAERLTALASRGDLVLASLTHAERTALGHDYLRFRVDQSTVVYVASPLDSVPFWVADQGFDATGWTLKVGESWGVAERELLESRIPRDCEAPTFPLFPALSSRKLSPPCEGG